MGYLSDVDGVDGLGCGSSCSCKSCSGKSPQGVNGLSEYYYEGEGRDPPRKQDAQMHGYGEGPTPGAATRDIKIVLKSYIAPIGTRAGVPYCSPFGPAKHAQLRALAYATDAMMSENPLTDVKDKHYRLYSSRTFRVTCNNGTIVSVVPTPVDADVGLECIPKTSQCLTPPPLSVYDVTGSLASPTAFQFAWTAKGRPHHVADLGFQAVCPRTSLYIWHRIEGRIECAGGEPRVTFTMTGSGFPSHRAWVNGVLRPPTIPQGPFSNLWVPKSLSDPTMVR